MKHLVLTALLGLAPLAVFAESLSLPEPTVTQSAGGLQFLPQTNYERATLTVAGSDGIVYEDTFLPGESIVYTPVNQDGFTLTDGSYQYQLLVLVHAPSGAGDEGFITRTSGTLIVAQGTLAPTSIDTETKE